jgi:hypothetical protein
MRGLAKKDPGQAFFGIESRVARRHYGTMAYQDFIQGTHKEILKYVHSVSASKLSLRVTQRAKAVWGGSYRACHVVVYRESKFKHHFK